MGKWKERAISLDELRDKIHEIVEPLWKEKGWQMSVAVQPFLSELTAATSVCIHEAKNEELLKEKLEVLQEDDGEAD